MPAHHPDLMKAAIEEFLRYDSPIQHQTRVAAEPLTISGNANSGRTTCTVDARSGESGSRSISRTGRLWIFRVSRTGMWHLAGDSLLLGSATGEAWRHRLRFLRFSAAFRKLVCRGIACDGGSHTSNRNPISYEAGLVAFLDAASRSEGPDRTQREATDLGRPPLTSG